MDNEKKSSAELAREERKARIEKSAEKQAVRKEKNENESAGKKRAKIIVPIIAVLLVIALALCYFFGVPQRTFAAVKLADGTKISIAEYEYYYMSMYNYYENYSKQCEQYYASYYGEGAGKTLTGFDYTKTPKAQKYAAAQGQESQIDTDKYGEDATWADYLEQSTVETCQVYTALYKNAKDADYKLTEDEQKEIDDYVEQLRTSAADNDYSLDAYLRANYGKGMTESLLRTIYEKQTLASDYLEAKQKEFQDDVSSDDIKAEYDKNKNEYNTVSLRYFDLYSTAAKNTDSTSYTDDELAEQTKKSNTETEAKANEFLGKVNADNFTSLAYDYVEDDYKSYYKDSDTYTSIKDSKYSDLEKNINADAADWVYDSSRAVGDKTSIKVENEDGSVTYYILLLTSLPTRDDTLQPVSIRQILFKFDNTTTDSDGNETKTTRTNAEAKAAAQAELDKWLAGDATEDAFSKLATADSEDTGSTDNGGLYESITKSSSYVKPFLDWCFADGRKVGDYGIIESEYGYHVMYMSSISDETQWESTIRESLATTKYNDFYEEISENKDYTPSVSKHFIKKVAGRVEDYAAKVIANDEKETTSAAAVADTTTEDTTEASN